MRSIHLVPLLVLVFVALAALWLGLGSAENAVRAQGDAEIAASSTSSPLTAHSADAAAAAKSTREAVLFPPTAEDIARAAADRRAQEKKIVTGRVVGPDETGKLLGIANATVWASTSENDWLKLPLDIETDGLPARWVMLQKVQTDPLGNFAIEGLAPGPLRMAVRASRFAPLYLDHLDLPPYTKHSVGDVKLEPGVTVTGRVLDAEGEGLAGANVLIALDCVRRSSLMVLPGRGVPACTSAADGSFVVDQLAYGPWHLMFEAPGYVLAERDGRLERAGETEKNVIVRLEKGVDISGKVVCKDADIPNGLRIGARLQPPHAEPGPDAEQNGPGIPKDDVRARYGLVESDGTFVVRGLKPYSSYRLTASRRAGDETAWKAFPSVEPQTAQSGTRGIELVYKPESALLMRVVDDATGAPLTDFVVAAGIGRERALRDDKGEVVHAFPEGKARYPELRVPATGGKPVVLRVSATGYKDHENKSVGLKPGVELDLGDIRMVPEHVVVVTVVDAVSSAPIEGARVLLSSQKTEAELTELADTPPETSLLGDAAWKTGVTGADGRARITSIPGKSVCFVASAKGHRPSLVEHAILPDDADHALELKLGRGGTVVAKVTDGAGHPVAGVGIQHRLPRRTADDDNVEEARKSDAEGVVRFEALAARVHGFQLHEEQGDVYFWGEDSERSDAPRWTDVGVAEDQTATVEFTAPPRADVIGIVREGGRPAEGAHVKFVPRKEGEQNHGMAYFGGQSDPFSTITAGDGAYKLEHLRCGEYTALVMTEHRKMAAEFKVRVSPDGAPHDFDLDVSGIEGRVVDQNGAPLAGVQVDCWRVQGGLDVESPYQMVVTEDDRGNPHVEWQQASSGRITTDQNGQYQITGVVPDEPVVVGVEGEWVERGSSAPITLSAGEMRHGVDFALRLAGKIEVSLAATGARRQEWFMVRVTKGEGAEAQTVTQSYVGGWNRTNTIPSIVPGHYKLALRRHGNESAPSLAEAEVDVAVGEISHVTFDPRR